MKKSLLVTAALLAISAMSASATEIYTGAGTTGFVLGAGSKLNDNFGVRAEGNYLNYSHSFSTSDVNYDAKIKFQDFSLLADYFPFSGSGFRLSAGAVVGNDKLSGQATGQSGTVTINGNQYSAAGQSLNVSAKFPTVRPYVGIGYGHHADKGLSFFVDLGVEYGKASVDLTASPGLAAQAGQANIDAERNKVQDKVNKLNAYPVFRLGVSETF